jgi:hypothetical protein
MNELVDIIESIGVLNDRAETSRWEVAGRIAEAYAEFPAYQRGLTAGLVQRLCKQSDSIYGYKHAENLRQRLSIAPVLSVSHFIALSELQERYALTDDLLREWIGRAVDDRLSVRGLRSEVALEHTLDVRAAWLRRARRVFKQVNSLFQDAEMVGLPESLYQITKTVQACVSDWTDKLGEWR